MPRTDRRPSRPKKRENEADTHPQGRHQGISRRPAAPGKEQTSQDDSRGDADNDADDNPLPRFEGGMWALSPILPRLEGCNARGEPLIAEHAQSVKSVALVPCLHVIPDLHRLTSVRRGVYAAHTGGRFSGCSTSQSFSFIPAICRRCSRYSISNAIGFCIALLLSHILLPCTSICPHCSGHSGAAHRMIDSIARANVMVWINAGR